MENIDNELINEYLDESYENLNVIDDGLIELEKQDHDEKLLDSIFRSFHTIKGTSGMFDLSKIESVAHKGENLLNVMREGKLEITTEIVTTLLKVADAMRHILKNIADTGSEGDNDFDDLKKEIVAHYEESASGNKNEENVSEANEKDTNNGLDYSLGFGVFEDEDSTAKDEKESVENRGPEKDNGDLKEIQIDAKQAEEVSKSPKQEVYQANNIKRKEHREEKVETIRVNVTVLDELMDLVSELVLSRNQLLSYISIESDETFQATCQQINSITTELQEKVMTTRMQPISITWNRLPRVIRDLALKSNKKIKVEMEGQDTEIDRSMIEIIKDPIMHIIRNSVDHGIETPEVRLSNGKKEEGIIRLSAYQANGQVYIDIMDDGGGINEERIKEKAVEKNVLTAEKAAVLSSKEALQLIFVPGFSTAQKVTNISGRGVGMDVVKTNIEKIGGTIEIESEIGKGSTFRLGLPLTLAIIPGLFVTCVGNFFAIAQNTMSELIRIKKENASKDIEFLHGVPVYRVRDHILPLVWLRSVLGYEVDTDKMIDNDFNIIILTAKGYKYGLVVDSIEDTQEIVVKPLGSHLKCVPFFDGATITGDGNIALILDAVGIARTAGILSSLKTAQNQEYKVIDSEEKVETESGFLIVQGKDDGRMALPMNDVTRLERLNVKDIEKVGDWDAIQYRGSILPLTYLVDLLPERRKANRISSPSLDPSILYLIVYVLEGERLGLVVDKILDIESRSIASKSEASREGVVANIVIKGRITELINIEWVLSKSFKNVNYSNEMKQLKLVDG